MLISKQDLITEARMHGYRPEILEKVFRLLDLIELFMSVTYLRERLALKGGTAINLFCSQELPRLSIDLDFNYIGSVDREAMMQDKVQLENIIIDLCRKEKYELHRNPRAHAGGKMVLIYQSILGNKGRLEIDLNYIFRVPLWHVNWKTSPSWPKATSVVALDIHELAAGKLHALLGREASRDLFDSHQLLTKWPLDHRKLRLAFTVYSGMEQDHWKRIGPDNIQFTVKDIRNKLIPVLKNSEIPQTSDKSIQTWATELVNTCRETLLSSVLPFQDNEMDFLEALQRFGEIRLEFISNDEEFCHRVSKHPSLLWRAQRVLK